MPTSKHDGNASHEYTTINTREDPDLGRKENAEEKEQAEPRRLKEFTISTFIALCWDVFLTLMPVAFLGEPVFSVFNGCFLDPHFFYILYTIHGASEYFTTLISTKTHGVLVSTARKQCARVTHFPADDRR